jgi:hypothetical protein
MTKLSIRLIFIQIANCILALFYKTTEFGVWEKWREIGYAERGNPRPAEFAIRQDGEMSE